MSYKAIYSYVWDLAETGVSAAIDEFHALGLDTVTVAGSYYAGKFLRPHGKAGKVYFPEAGRPTSRLSTVRPITSGALLTTKARSSKPLSQKGGIGRPR